jgi:hypothetical protein
MQSLDLVFDDATDARVRRDWRLLADAGLPSQALHRGFSNAPHVTLLSGPTLAMPDHSRLALLPLNVALGGPVVLGNGLRLVIARLVVPSRELLRLHAALFEVLGPGGDGPFDAPDDWVPHVTLARGVPAEQVGRAVGLIDDTGVQASLVAVRHWDSSTRQLTRLE